MKQGLFKLATFLFLFVVFQDVNCQESWIDQSFHIDLIPFENKGNFEVYSSDSLTQELKETVKNVSSAKEYYDGLFQVNMDFALLFIGNKEWKNHSFFPPPGLPQAGRGNVIVGFNESLMAQNVKNVLKKLPEPALTNLKKVYGKELNLDLFYRETLVFHELAHLYHFKFAQKPQRKWLQEIYATMSMYSFIAQKAKKQYHEMDTYPIFILNSNQPLPLHTSLKDFEELYVQKLSPQNYEWYQMQLYRIAKKIMANEDESILQRLRSFLIEFDRSKYPSFSDKKLADLLKHEVSPALAEIIEKWPNLN